WGVGDFLTPGMDPKVAITVGKTDIRTETVERRFMRAFDQFKQSREAQNANRDEVKQMILASTVQGMARTATADAVAGDLGIVIPVARVRDAIREEPGFKDPNGSFSQLRYAQILANNNLTEKAFVADLTSELREKTMLDPV